MYIAYYHLFILLKPVSQLPQTRVEKGSAKSYCLNLSVFLRDEKIKTFRIWVNFFPIQEHIIFYDLKLLYFLAIQRYKYQLLYFCPE